MKEHSKNDVVVVEALPPHRPFYQRKAVCVPLAWLFLVVLAVLFLNPWSPTFRRLGSNSVLAPLIFVCFGGIFSVPLQCALWGAWAPDALKWRLAIGAAAAVALGILASVADGRATALILFATLFTLFWTALALIRMSRGIRIQTSNQAREPGRAGFGIGYLLGLTAVVSVLASCGQQGLNGNASLGPSALHFVIFLVLIGLLVLQAVFAWVLVLGTHRRVVVGLIGVPATVVAVSYATTTAMDAIQPGPEFWQVCSIAGGAVVSTTGFALALRLGGYRLAWSKSSRP